MLFRTIIVLAYVIACYKYGDWKNWKEYYPTILFVIIGDLSYNFVFYNHSLWEYERLVNHTFSSYVYLFVVYPCAIILFFTYFPKKLWAQGLYILSWTGINTLLEFISIKIGYFSHHNEWNIFWSAGVFFFAFILVRLHYKTPLAAWLISGAFALITMYLFNQPISNLK